MDKPLQILYLEDNDADAGLTTRALKKAGFIFNMIVVETAREFTRALHEFVPDIILSDHSLPGFNSMEAFKIVKDQRPGTPFILLTGAVSEEFAVDCLLAGIDDYILKSNLIRLPSSINRVLSKKKIADEKETIESLHKELQETYRQIELKNKETRDSINYARRIQDAILPNNNLFKEDFHEGFAIYEPRDIVSGDLYWMAKTTTTDAQQLALKIVAAIDCTGHGIPGAFMTLLVSELLNQTLQNKDINSPADVLHYLNKQLPQSLNRNRKQRISDGLDIALCAFDLPRRQVYFSGANRPLWILRKGAGGYDIIIHKGAKVSIGANTSDERIFNTTKIDLEPGDRVFLFTDGITDQFGGVFGKKLGRKKLQEVLIDSAGIDIKYQRQYIASFLNNWRGDYEQVDDILVIGIEIK